MRVSFPRDISDLGFDDQLEKPRSPISKVGILLAGIVIFVSFLPWAWRWSPWADRTADGLLDDPTYATLAEPVCAAALDELGELPTALEAESPAERGEQVRAANVILTELVDDLEGLITGSERDVENLNEWIGDWRTYLDNRVDYAERVSVDGDAVFFVSAQGIERLDRRIPRFAVANEMFSCITPDDIA